MSPQPEADPPSGNSSDSEESGTSTPSSQESNSNPSETQKALGAIKPGYPATALINILLQHYNIDFGKYKRNTNISHKLLEIWKKIYEAVLDEMDKVHQAGDTPDWDAFEKYTKAIAPFEEELLKLESPLADNEAPALPTKDSVSALIAFMIKWVENRRNFIDTGEKLDEDPFTALSSGSLDAKSSVSQAIRDDDKQVLKELTEKIEAYNTLTDADIYGSGPGDDFVTTVKSKVRAIHTAADGLAPEDHVEMGKIVHAVMALYIPFLAHEKDEEDAHIVSKKVWDAAKVFADETEQFANKSSTITPAQFDDKWEVYKNVLMDQIGEFAMQMVTLMRLAGQARRPFFGRTIGIVRMWEAISKAPEIAKENQLSARKNLQKLLADTETEFKKTRDEVKSFTLDVADLESRRNSYTELVGRLKPEIVKYNSAKWDTVEEAYEKGAKVDDDHLAKYIAFIDKNKQAADLKAAA